MVSYDCGFTINHKLFRVLYDKTLIDTIIILDPLVNLEDYENLKIYIEPAVADTAL